MVYLVSISNNYCKSCSKYRNGSFHGGSCSDVIEVENSVIVFFDSPRVRAVVEVHGAPVELTFVFIHRQADNSTVCPVLTINILDLEVELKTYMPVQYLLILVINLVGAYVSSAKYTRRGVKVVYLGFVGTGVSLFFV